MRLTPLLLIALAGLVLLVSARAGEPPSIALAADPAADAPPHASGDVDCSGTIDSTDAIQILQVTAELVPSASCAALGDVDCNSAMEAIDALDILKFASGVESPSQADSLCPSIGVPSLNLLTIDKFGDGELSASVALAYCDSDCNVKTIALPEDTVVQFDAIAGADSEFSDWSGCDVSEGLVCSLALATDRTLSATFSSGDLKFYSTTKILNMEAMSHLLSNEGETYTFDAASATISSIQMGDVILSTVNGGLLRRVTGIDSSSNEIVVQTTDATLADAIESGTLSSSNLPPELSASASPNVVPATGPLCEATGTKTFACSVPIDRSLPNGVDLSGQLSFDAAPVFNADKGRNEVQAFINFSNLNATISASITRDMTVGFEQPIPLPPIPLPQIGAYVTPSIKVGITGTARAGISTTFTIRGNYTIGAEFINGTWATRSSPPFTVSASSPSFAVGADAKVYVEPNFEVTFLGAVKLNTGLEGYLLAKYSPPQVPCWSVYVGVKAKASISVGLLGWALPVFPAASLQLYERRLTQPCSSTNPPPTITSPPSLPPSSPNLFSPSNGSTFPQVQGITLSWNTSGAQSYTELWGGPYSTLSFGGWTARTTLPIGQMWPGTYSWHVKARNGTAESGWSATRTFTIGPLQNLTPSLTSPPNGSSFPQSRDITLSWNTTGAQSYTELWGGPYNTLNFGGWTARTNLLIGQMWPGTYSWHVRARNGSSETAWSPTWTFTIGASPGPTPPPNGCSPSADQIALFVDDNYDGQCVVRGIGDYANPNAIGLPNDSVSSIKVGSNVKGQLCRDDNFSNTCEWFDTDDPDLTNNSLDDNQVSSARVQSRVQPPTPTPTSTPGANAPTVPSNVVATLENYWYLNVTWRDNSNNEDGFRIYDNADPVLIGEVDANTTSFTFNAMAYPWAMAFRVEAFNSSSGSGLSAYSDPNINIPIQTVKVDDSGFDPSTVNVSGITRVIFVNRGTGDSNVSSDLPNSDPLWPFLQLGTFPPNSSVQAQLRTPGSYPYHNELNPSQIGTVVVDDPLATSSPVDANISSTGYGWQFVNFHLNAGESFSISFESGCWTVDSSLFSCVGPDGYSPGEDAMIYQETNCPENRGKLRLPVAPCLP